MWKNEVNTDGSKQILLGWFSDFSFPVGRLSVWWTLLDYS